MEAAAPTEAIEVVTHQLAAMVDARTVSFLIADFSGDAVVRFGRAEPGSDTASPDGGRKLETVPLAGRAFTALRIRALTDSIALVTGPGLPKLTPAAR